MCTDFYLQDDPHSQSTAPSPQGPARASQGLCRWDVLLTCPKPQDPSAARGQGSLTHDWVQARVRKNTCFPAQQVSLVPVGFWFDCNIAKQRHCPTSKKKRKKTQYKFLPFVGQELKQRITEKCIMSAGNGELLGKRAALAIFWRSCSLGLGRWKGEDGPVGHRARRSSWNSVGRGRWEAHTWDYQAFLGSLDFPETFLKLCWDGERLGPDPTLIWKSLLLVDQKILHFTIPNRSRYKKLPISMVMRNLMVLGQAALVTQGRAMWWVGLDHSRDSGW